MNIRSYKQILAWGKDLDGVFSIQDLRIAFSSLTQSSLYREIQALIVAGDLIKVKKGFYATIGASLADVSARLYPKSYVSTGTVLAQHKIIGSVPDKKIQVVRVGTPTSFSCSLGSIESLSVARKLYFGFAKKDNVFWADAEKAYLDSCYFFYKGKKFSFDLYTDVNLNRLDMKRLKSYLNKYDQRFISYFNKNFAQKT